MITDILSSLIRILRPFFGIAGTCRYTITCSAYARYALRTYPFYKAFWRIFKRVLSCNFLVTL